MHKPNTSVNFAPTAAFTRAFPNDVQAQAAEFVKPTWSLNVEEKPPKEKEELFVPKQLTEDWVKIDAEQRSADRKRGKAADIAIVTMTQDELTSDMLKALFVGVGMGIGVAFLINHFRGGVVAQ